MPTDPHIAAAVLVAYATAATHQAAPAYDYARSHGVTSSTPLGRAIGDALVFSADAQRAAEKHLRELDAPTPEETTDA